MKDPAAAEKVLQQATEADPHSEIALFNLAIIYHKFDFCLQRHIFCQSNCNAFRHLVDLTAAVNCLKTLLEKNSRHAVAAHMLARIFVDKFKKMLVDTAMASSPRRSARFLLLGS